MKRVSKNKSRYYFAPDVEPVLSVSPMETIIVETQDANSGILEKETDIWPSADELSRRGIEGVNPVTGPIYVEGVVPGDCLLVNIEHIKCGPYGICTVDPGLGGLSGPYSIYPPVAARTKICPISDGQVLFPTATGKHIELPVRPIIGTIGVAPKVEKIATVWHGQEHCGNIDSPDVAPGNKVILRANVPGGLLSLGDAAVITGDGELCNSHIDTTSEITITVDVLKKKDAGYMSWPQIEYPESIGSIGCPMSGSLDDAYRAAYSDLVQRMVQFYSFDLFDAYQLVSCVGEVRVNQGIDPSWYCCTAKIMKRFLQPR
jgi:amidase